MKRRPEFVILGKQGKNARVIFLKLPLDKVTTVCQFLHSLSGRMILTLSIEDDPCAPYRGTPTSTHQPEIAQDSALSRATLKGVLGVGCWSILRKLLETPTLPHCEKDRLLYGVDKNRLHVFLPSKASIDTTKQSLFKNHCVDPWLP